MSTEITTADPAPDLLSVIERVVNNPDSDIDKMRELLAMKKSIDADLTEKEFNIAMSAVQSVTMVIAANADNPATRSKYATYAALDRLLRPVYTRHGFSVTFNTGEGAPAEHVRVICIIAHNAGHTRRLSIDMPSDGKGAKGGSVMTRTHATGSAVTYGRRYLLMMAFNIAVADDDGNAAGAEPLNEEELAELLSIADGNGCDKAKFCEIHKVSSFAEIHRSKFQQAKTALSAYAGGQT